MKDIKELKVQLHEQLYNELKKAPNYIDPDILFGKSEFNITFALNNISRLECHFDIQNYHLYYDKYKNLFGNITLTCDIPIVDKYLIGDFQDELIKMVCDNDNIDRVDIKTIYNDWEKRLCIKFFYTCAELDNFKIIPYVEKFMNVYESKVLNKNRVDNPNHWNILNENGFLDVLVKHSPLAKYKLCDYTPWFDRITRELPIFIKLDCIHDDDKYIHIGSTCGVFEGPELRFKNFHWFEAQQVYTWNESYWECPPSGYDSRCILIQANHKGLLWSGLILFPEHMEKIEVSETL